MFKQIAENWPSMASMGGKIPVQWTSAHMDTKGIDIAATPRPSFSSFQVYHTLKKTIPR